MSIFGRPKPIGVALGGGGARGLAHIGVIKVLEAEGIVPAAISGTSMGAIVGAFWAAGYTAAQMAEVALALDPRTLGTFDQVALRTGAMLSGNSVEAMLREYLPATFEELRVPFGCVATDLITDTAVRFTSGDLIRALRASMSIPLVFTPVRTDGMLLVDGYVAEPVPVELARSLGGVTVVAVEVSGSGTVNLGAERQRARPVQELRAAIRGEALTRGTSSVDIVSAVSEAFEKRLARAALTSAQVVISPEVHEFTAFEYARAGHLMERGEEAGRGAVGAIRRTARLR